MQPTINPQLFMSVDVSDITEAQRLTLWSVICLTIAEMIHPASTEPIGLHGWTYETLLQLVFRIKARRSHIQAKALEIVLKKGSISRAEVYVLGGFASNRKLNGFTRPVNDAVRAMKDAGEIPEDAVNPFKPIYNYDDPSYQKAQGFNCPSELSALWNESHDEAIVAKTVLEHRQATARRAAERLEGEAS